MEWIDVSKLADWIPRMRPHFVMASRTSELVELLRKSGFAVAMADGSRMLDKTGVFSEFGRALGYPDYFGSNWDAFNDCLFTYFREIRNPTALLLLNASEFSRRDLALYTKVADKLSRLYAIWSAPHYSAYRARQPQLETFIIVDG